MEDAFREVPTGQLLQPDRDSPEAIEELKRELGSRIFAAQFQQNPTPADGNMIKVDWLARYQPTTGRRKFRPYDSGLGQGLSDLGRRDGRRHRRGSNMGSLAACGERDIGERRRSAICRLSLNVVPAFGAGEGSGNM